MRPVLVVVAILVVGSVAPGVAAAAGALDDSGHAVGSAPALATTANATVNGTVTYLNGTPAASATVLVGSADRLQSASPAELRELAASNPDGVAVAEADADGRYSLTVDADEVETEAVVAVTPDGVSRVRQFRADEVDLTVRTAERLTVEVSGGTTEPSGRIPVVVELTNTGDAAVERLSVTLGQVPDGWNVASGSSESGTYYQSNRTFVWQRVAPGETVTAEVRLFVAIEAETKRYELPVFADSRTHPVTAEDAVVEVRYPTERQESEIRVPGFGPVVALAALALAALGALARRD